MTVLESIRVLLTQEGVTFRELHHAPTRTSEESAKARVVPLAIGGKALLMKVGEDHALFVISAARRIDSGARWRSALGNPCAHSIAAAVSWLAQRRAASSRT